MSTIGVIGTPPMKATARTIAHITIADPRSPCTRHAPAAQAATRAIGRRLRRTSASTSWRRTSRSAQNSTSASLRNSDGCRLNEPTVTHALASLIVEPTDGTNGSAIAGGGQDDQRDRPAGAPTARCMRMAIEHPDEPEGGPRHLAAEHVVRAVALRRLDGRRRRQHHHQAEHHEHGDDDADHVVGDRRRAVLDVPHAGRGSVLAAVVALARVGTLPLCSRSSACCRRSATRRPDRDGIVASDASERAPASERSHRPAWPGTIVMACLLRVVRWTSRRKSSPRAG